MKNKITRLMDNIALRKQKSEDYKKASPKGKALIQKEINILIRRIRDMFEELQEIGKGKILKVVYSIPSSENPGHLEVFEETFIGMDEEDIPFLFEGRSYITGKPYTILEILVDRTYVRKSHTI